MSPDERSLLRAVLDDPEEDSVRLIYADWLEEDGRPERAEFIRVQIEHDRLPVTQTARRRVLRVRQTNLVAEHASAWVTGLPPMVQAHVFHRGFVEQVRMLGPGDGAELVTQFEALLCVEPVSCLHLQSGVIDPSCVDGSYRPLSMSDLAALVAAPCARRLRALDVSMAAIHDAGAVVLASGECLTNLERLRMYAIGLTDSGACALADSHCLPRLRWLDLSCNAISPEGARRLRARFGDGLRLEADDPQVIVWPRHNAPLPWEVDHAD